MPLADLDRIAKVAGIEVITKGYEALTYQLVVEINHRRKELADLKVRQAIAHAIDKDFVVKTVFLGYATAADRPGAEERQAVLYCRRADLCLRRRQGQRAARRGRLQARAPTATRFTLKLLPAPYFNETKQFGDYLRQALAAIGIDAETRQQRRRPRTRRPSTPTMPSTSRSAPPVFRGDPAISTTILVQSGIPDGVPFSNQGGYKNAELDALIAKAAETLDPAARTRTLQGFPEKGRGRPAADQRRRMGLHHAWPANGEERRQQPALGGVELGGYLAGGLEAFAPGLHMMCPGAQLR